MSNSNTNFMLLFLGRLISRLGDSVFTIGVGWYILELTGSPVQMSSFIAVMTLTMVIAGPIGGNIVDQFKKVKLIYLMDFIRGFVVILTALTILLSNNTTLIIVVMYVMAIVSALCTVVFNPASSAIVPLIMSKEDLVKANSYMSLTGSMTTIFGLLLGGVLYGLIGPFGVILIDGISYILSGISEMFIKVIEPENIKSKSKHLMKEQVEIFKEGIRYLTKHKGLIYIGVFATVLNFSLVPLFQVYTPYLIKIVLGKEIITLTVLQITISVGMFVGGILLSRFGKSNEKTRLTHMLRRFSVLLIILLCTLAIVVISVVNSKISYELFISLFGITAFFIGGLVAVINIPIETYIQQNTETAMMGRVNSVLGTLSMATVPLALVLGGIAVELISVEFAYFFSAIVLVITTGTLLFRKELS